MTLLALRISVKILPPSLHVLALALAFTACERKEAAVATPRPLRERVTWNGEASSAYHVDSAGILGQWPGGLRRLHTLEFRSRDSLDLILHEYSQDWQAFRAFQAQAIREEVGQGYFRQKNSLFFFHGPFFGELRSVGSSLLPGSYLEDRLVFEGEALFRRPDVFKSFPLIGQIPNSEQVLSTDFLRSGGSEPVFAMSYRCQGDTALVFRGFSPFPKEYQAWADDWSGRVDTLEWGGEWRFRGRDDLGRPMNFWIFKGGFLGVEGCFDPELAEEYAEKMKKMAILLETPRN
jgi:hypothetical protein